MDVVACHLIGLDPRDVPTIQAAAEVGYGETRLSEITVLGADLEALRLTDFELIREIASVLRILPLPEAAQHWIRRQWQPRPRIVAERCIHCGACKEGCPVDPSAIDPATAASADLATTGGVDDATCIRCYCCHEFCPEKAIDLQQGRLAWLFRPLERV